MKNVSKKLIIALDFGSKKEALQWVDVFLPYVEQFKVGSQLFTKEGPSIVNEIQKRGGRVFLDLKYHDIPNTVAKACEEACSLSVWMLNVHALGGYEMLKGAKEAIDKTTLSSKPLLMAVTVLTSLSKNDLEEMGTKMSPKELAIRLARLSKKAGVDGVVCSVEEVKVIKKTFGKDFLTITPGIRLEEGSCSQVDQKRSSTIEAAIEAGSDYCVLGRSLFQAKDPLLLLKQIIRPEGFQKFSS